MKKNLTKTKHSQKGKSKIVDCRKNGEVSKSNDEGKIPIRVNELNIWLLVDQDKISTDKKRAEFIECYKKNLSESRKRFGELYTVVD